MFPHTNSPFVRLYEDVNYERHLFIMVDSYFRLLHTKALTNEKIKVDIKLFCINFPFDEAWFIQRDEYWLTGLQFELSAHRTHHNSSARVLVCWHNVELLAACPQDRPILYVSFESFECSSYLSHRHLGLLWQLDSPISWRLETFILGSRAQ